MLAAVEAAVATAAAAAATAVAAAALAAAAVAVAIAADHPPALTFLAAGPVELLDGAIYWR